MIRNPLDPSDLIEKGRQRFKCKRFFYFILLFVDTWSLRIRFSLVNSPFWLIRTGNSRLGDSVLSSRLGFLVTSDPVAGT